MSYTEQDMMAAAEAHYRAAAAVLSVGGTSVQQATMQAAMATADAQAGLLAIELAKYAGDPNRGIADL